MHKFFLSKVYIISILLLTFTKSSADIIKEIKVNGNERISEKSIILFSKAKLNEDVNQDDLNFFLKNLYETNFFKDISLKFENNILFINISEEPIIQNVKLEGIKANKIIDPIKNSLQLKDRSSFKENIFYQDQKNIEKTLRSMGYYFSKISASIEDLIKLI